MQDAEVVPTWQSLLLDLGYLLENLAYHGISSLKTIVGLYLNTCTPGQLGRTLAFIRKVKQWSSRLCADLNSPKVLKELQKAFREKRKMGRSPVSPEPSRS